MTPETKETDFAPKTTDLSRDTKETSIGCTMHLDGTGVSKIYTDIDFFDHMLTLFSFRSRIDLTLHANGDLQVCDHHTVEGCGIMIEACLKETLQDKGGIERYGSMLLPMGKTLAQVVLDIDGHNFLVYNCELRRDTIDSFSCEMMGEFLRVLAFQTGIILYVNVMCGANDRHEVEATFKALGRVLKATVRVSGDTLPSTKGKL